MHGQAVGEISRGAQVQAPGRSDNGILAGQQRVECGYKRSGPLVARSTCEGANFSAPWMHVIR